MLLKRTPILIGQYKTCANFRSKPFYNTTKRQLNGDKYRIKYKLATLAFRHFDGTLPPYLSSSLCTYQPSRSLRSSTERLLKIPKTNLKTFGGRSFGYIAPTVWNSLPADLRASPSLQSFKVNLKTHLFRQAF